MRVKEAKPPARDREVLVENEPLYWDMRHVCKPEVKRTRERIGNGPFVPLRVTQERMKEAQIVHIMPKAETLEIPGVYLTHIPYEDQGALP